MRIEANRIAIVKLGAIGDAVNTLPFINRLRRGRPDAWLTWVIGPTAHALLRGHAAIDEFLLFDKERPTTWPAFVRSLRSARFDLAIDLQRILKSAAIVRASGAPLRLGFDRVRCKEASWVATNVRIPPNPRPGVTVAQYLEFADYLELPASAPEWNLSFVPEPRDDDETRIVVNLGASKPANRWYAERWSELCTRLVEELRASVHLTGGREDRATADLVLSQLSVPISDHVGKRSLKESAALIASADLFVGCDTGPLHIAAAVGTPCVALFGASDPGRTGPFGQGHVIVSRPAACSPCKRRECDVDGHPCMRAIGAELVFAEVARRLADGVASHGAV